MSIVTSAPFERSTLFVDRWLLAAIAGIDDAESGMHPLGDACVARMVRVFEERLGGVPGLLRLCTELRTEARPHLVLTARVFEMMWDAYADTHDSARWARHGPPRVEEEKAEEPASFPVLEALVKRVIAEHGHAVADRMLLYYTSAEERLACERRLRALLHEDAPR